MKFSENWLRDWVNPDISSDELVAQLTMAGLEVDGTEPAAALFTGVVVGEILSVLPHPDADKLRVCQVDDGTEKRQVVCGAANVATGQKVAFAQVGAQLGPDFKIRKAKLRGVESHGMICAADELGMAEKSDGVLVLPSDAPTGEDFRDYLGLDDHLIEVDLTPNRGDCLSIAGLAREVGVLNRMAVNGPAIDAVPATIDDTLPIELQSPADCPRYLGRVIRNVNPQVTTSVWMKEKLRRSGIRSIDPVVDVTNYVLIELGQPLHAFDLDMLKGGIRVRRANPDEKLRLLDGREVPLTEDILVIADHEKALAMAGIMGGEDSGVTSATRHIFLESAFFNPLTVAGKARSYGMQTDASHRFERGVDYDLPRLAMERATELLLAITGGEAGPVIEAVDKLPEALTVRLRADRISMLLGIDLPASEVEDILERLGMKLVDKDADGWTYAVPSYRFDISIEADLIEEVARIYGYDNIPVTRPTQPMSLRAKPEVRLDLKDIRRFLCDQGYQEVITYSFVEPDLQAKLGEDRGRAITLANPISQDMSDMRMGLWPGLIKTLKHNQNRQQSRVRIFEAGLVFNRRDAQIEQVPRVGGLIWGHRLPEHWSGTSEDSDFFDLKGDVESLLGLTLDEGAFAFQPGEHPALQPGQTARILRNDREIGWMGAVHPRIHQALDIPGKVYVFELDLQALREKRLPSSGTLSKFPSVRRDLALIVAQDLAFEKLETAIRNVAGDILMDLLVFDVYSGENIGKDKKSIALGLTFQHPSRTLNDDEINGIIGSCIKELEQQFNADLR